MENNPPSEEEEVLHDYDACAPVNMVLRPEEQSSRLREYVATDSVDLVKAHLEEKGDVNISNNLGDTLLHTALKYHRMKTLEYLLQRDDIRINAENFRGETPLLVALRENYSTDLVHKIVDLGANFLTPNVEQVTPLHIAVRRESPEIALRFIKGGANVDAQDADGFTPLHESVAHNRYESTCMLLYYNASVNEISLYKFSAFLLAVRNKNKEIFDLLIDYVVDLNQLNYDGHSALYTSLTTDFNVWEEIIERGGDINFVGNTPCTLLALEKHNIRVARLFWFNADHDILLRNGFSLHKYLSLMERYPEKDKVQTIEWIFSSPRIGDFIESDMPFRRGSELYLFLYVYFLKDLDVGERLKYLYLLLSESVPITNTQIGFIMQFFGYSEDIEAILSSETRIIDQANDTRRETAFANWIIFNYGHSLHCHHFRVEFCGMERWLPFKRRPGSLVQLARDKIREVVYRKYASGASLKAYNAVKGWELPDIIKDIILLKQPIYR